MFLHETVNFLYKYMYHCNPNFSDTLIFYINLHLIL